MSELRPESMMRDAQNKVVTELFERDFSIAVVPMGGGKTAATMTAIKELIDEGDIRRALVLAPKKVATLVWPLEHKEWEHLQHLRIVEVKGPPAQREKKLLHTDGDIFVMGLDNTVWLCDLVKNMGSDHPVFDMLVIDEISKFKAPTSNRSKALAKKARKWSMRHGLTGTPRPQNGDLDLFMPLRIITAGKLWGTSYWDWRSANFMATDYNGYNWVIHPGARDKIKRDAARYMFTIDEMPDLPPYQPVFHWVDLPKDARRQYDEMVRHLVTKHYDPDGERWIDAANQAVAVGKLMQLAQGFLYDDDKKYVADVHTAKLDYYKDTFSSLEESAIVCFWFQEDYQRLRDAHKGGLPYLGKAVNDKAALKRQERWNEGDIWRLGLHPASAGHGLNLQHGGHQMIWYGLPTGSTELYDQTLKRIVRPGQKMPTFGHHILARDTYDEVIYNRIANNMTEQEAFRQFLPKVDI